MPDKNMETESNIKTETKKVVNFILTEEEFNTFGKDIFYISKDGKFGDAITISFKDGGTTLLSAKWMNINEDKNTVSFGIPQLDKDNEIRNFKIAYYNKETKIVDKVISVSGQDVVNTLVIDYKLTIAPDRTPFEYLKK